MKRTFLSLIIVFSFFVYSCNSGSNSEGDNVENTDQENVIDDSEAAVATTTFMVYGNCGMCATRIEDALKSLDGVETAKWNIETKKVTVSFDEAKVKEDLMHKKVAEVGHDTEKEKATDEVYDSLAGCCKYRDGNPHGE